MTQDGKYVIGLDFNGTCVSYNYPHSIGNDIGSVPILKKLLANGHKFVLMWISCGLKGVLIFFGAMLFIVVFVFGFTKWVEFVDKHIKD